jgi:transposase
LGVSENPSFLKKSEEKLARAQRVLSIRKRGPSNRQKQRRKDSKGTSKDC